jgi:MFS family permease
MAADESRRSDDRDTDMMSATASAAQSRPRDVDALPGIAAAIYAGVVGSMVFIVLPVLVGLLAERGGLTDRELGLVASAQMLGMFLASLAATALIPRAGPRRLAAGSAIALGACHFGSMSATSTGLLALQGAGGFFGGLLMAVSMAQLGRTAQPDRNFALWISAQIALGVLGTVALPRAAAAGGLGAAFLVLGVLALSVLGAVPSLARAARSSGPARARRKPSAAGLLSLLAAFCFALGIMAVWPYLELIARDRGIAADSVGRIVSLALVASLAGALIASALAGRYERSRPLTASLLGMLLILPALGSVVGAFAFTLAAIGFAALWNFAVPYQLATTSANDAGGTLIVFYISAVKAGYAVAPLLSSRFLHGSGYGPVFWIAAAGLAASAVLYLLTRVVGEQGAREAARTALSDGREVAS